MSLRPRHCPECMRWRKAAHAASDRADAERELRKRLREWLTAKRLPWGCVELVAHTLTELERELLGEEK